MGSFSFSFSFSFRFVSFRSIRTSEDWDLGSGLGGGLFRVRRVRENRQNGQPRAGDLSGYLEKIELSIVFG